MKKVMMIMAMALMASAMSFAQEQKQTRPAGRMMRTEMAKMRTQHMVKELGLSAAQADSLYVLNKEFSDVMMPGKLPRRIEGNDSTKVKPSEEQMAKRKEQMEQRKEQMEQYESRLKKILTEDQLKKYEENKKNRMNNSKRRPGMGRRPNSPSGMMPQNNQNADNE